MAALLLLKTEGLVKVRVGLKHTRLAALPPTSVAQQSGKMMASCEGSQVLVRREPENGGSLLW